MVGRMRRSMMCRAMRCVIGPRDCVMWARVTGRVAMRVHVETWDRREKRPDCERARKPVPNAMEDEMRYEEALECRWVLVVRLLVVVDIMW